MRVTNHVFTHTHTQHVQPTHTHTHTHSHVGKYLETSAKAKTTSAVSTLGELAPKEAVWLRPDLEVSQVSEEGKPAGGVRGKEELWYPLAQGGVNLCVLV